MSMYEILTMLQELQERRKKDKPKEVTDEEWDHAEELLKSVTANDPKVRL